MDEMRLSVLDHLEEMRLRIIRSLICVAVLFPLCYLGCDDTLTWFLATFCPQLEEVQTLQIMELFFMKMKISAIMALVAAYPYIAWQIWGFVAPGLYDHERRYASRAVLASTLLFLGGAALALFIVFPAVLRFALSLQTPEIRLRPQLRSVISMATVLMLGFGAMFQLPIVVYLLAVLDVVSVETMRRARPVAVVVVFIVAAMVTPGPDIISQCALALPSLLLFELSLIVAGRAVRARARDGDPDSRRPPKPPRGAPPPPAPRPPEPSEPSAAPAPPSQAPARPLTPRPDGPLAAPERLHQSPPPNATWRTPRPGRPDAAPTTALDDDGPAGSG
ncbi:MAG: twin-arginine translocase subunit TatC, partial [Lentisphaerae bacterium]|nr:twin-arginine translocase subunit TatC [Lentisphaerota bacterium]